MTKIKIKQYISFQRAMAFACLVGLVLISLSSPLSAQSVTQGYGSDQSVQSGMIIKIKKSDPTKIELVTSDSAEQMHGIAVDANDAPVTLSADGQKIFVATTGKFEVLVSNQNGEVKTGDFITISAIDGIGMKAGTIEPYIVGRALGGFNGNENVVSSTEVKDSTGATQKVTIGKVEMDVGIGKNPNLKGKEPNLPEFLKKAVEGIAGKPVNAVRVYIALFVFTATCIIAGILFYSGVRNGIISIGRNPLSKKSIIRSMMQVIIVAITIFISGIFGVYLLLKL